MLRGTDSDGETTCCERRFPLTAERFLANGPEAQLANSTGPGIGCASVRIEDFAAIHSLTTRRTDGARRGTNPPLLGRLLVAKSRGYPVHTCFLGGRRLARKCCHLSGLSHATMGKVVCSETCFECRRFHSPVCRPTTSLSAVLLYTTVPCPLLERPNLSSYTTCSQG